MASEIGTHLPPVWQIWRNPLVWRYAHSRLRLRPTIFWALLVLMVTYFAAAMVYLPAVQRGALDAERAARNLLWVALAVQAPLLLFLGTGAVAYGTVNERLSGALDYQRMAPLTPTHKIIGYLFGLPIREYLLCALTLPVVLFAMLRGDIPLLRILIVYAMIFSSGVLYHLTALALGMVINKWWVAAFGTQVAIFLLYVVLPQLSNVQIHLFESLTILPAVAHHWGPYLLPRSTGETVFLFGEWGDRVVPFFNYAIPQTWFSLSLQLVFMGILYAMLRRKWVQEHYHALGKGQSLLVLAFFQFLLLANLWPIFTNDLTGEVQSRFPLPVPPEAIATVISVVVTLLLLALAVWLIFVVAPSWHSHQRGWRRARRLGLSGVPWWWDESPAFGVFAVIAGSSAAMVAGVLALLARTGYFSLTEGGWTDRLPAAFALGGLLFVLGCAGVTLGKGRTVILVLLLGILPIMVATVLASVNEDRFGDPAFFIIALSPLGTLILSLVAPNLPPEAGSTLTGMVPGMWTGLVLLPLYAGVLCFGWWRRARRIRRAEA